jgi:hypothetical protein
MAAAGMLGALLAAGCGGGGSAGHGDTAATRYLEVGVFLDNEFYRVHGVDSEVDAAAIMNVVGSYFANSDELSRNRVVLVLVGFHTITGGTDPWLLPGPVTVPAVADDLLGKFSTYVGSNRPFGFDAAILLSGLPFAGGKLGASSWRTVCSLSSAYAVAHVTEMNLPLTAATVARELGSNLGMCLDPPGTRGPACPDLSGLADAGVAACSSRIMSASLAPNAPPDRFSACSAIDLDRFVDLLPSDRNCLAPPARVSLGTGSVR